MIFLGIMKKPYYKAVLFLSKHVKILFFQFPLIYNICTRSIVKKNKKIKWTWYPVCSIVVSDKNVYKHNVLMAAMIQPYVAQLVLTSFHHHHILHN